LAAIVPLPGSILRKHLGQQEDFIGSAQVHVSCLGHRKLPRRASRYLRITGRTQTLFQFSGRRLTFDATRLNLEPAEGSCVVEEKKRKIPGTFETLIPIIGNQLRREVKVTSLQLLPNKTATDGCCKTALSERG
jgi:hypothetical protein